MTHSCRRSNPLLASAIGSQPSSLAADIRVRGGASRGLARRHMRRCLRHSPPAPHHRFARRRSGTCASIPSHRPFSRTWPTTDCQSSRSFFVHLATKTVCHGRPGEPREVYFHFRAFESFAAFPGAACRGKNCTYRQHGRCMSPRCRAGTVRDCRADNPLHGYDLTGITGSAPLPRSRAEQGSSTGQRYNRRVSSRARQIQYLGRTCRIRRSRTGLQNGALENTTAWACRFCAVDNSRRRNRRKRKDRYSASPCRNPVPHSRVGKGIVGIVAVPARSDKQPPIQAPTRSRIPARHSLPFLVECNAPGLPGTFSCAGHDSRT